MATTPPEFAALARSLSRGGQDTSLVFTQNVFDYVRNNIAIEFHFGSAKGARGALIDQSGTDFDQAELMVTLLRTGASMYPTYASISPAYQLGTITLTPTQFGQWSGLIYGLNQSNQSFSVDAASTCKFLADGGIPATVNGASSCAGLVGPLSSLTLAHIWVSADGKIYDPSFKLHTFKTGLNLASATGCAATSCASTLAATVMTGATTGTIGAANVSTVQHLDEIDTEAQMNTYARNVEAYVRANSPNAQLDDVIGGARIDVTYLPAVGSVLPYPSTAVYTWPGDIPDQFRSTLNVQYNGINKTFYSDEISAKRVRLFADVNISSIGAGGTVVSGIGTLALPITYKIFADDDLVQSLVCNSSCAYGWGSVLSLSASHPYAAGAYANQTITPPVTEPVTLVQGWGEGSSSTLSYFADLQTVDPTPWVASSGSAFMCEQPNSSISALSNYTIDDPPVPGCRADEQPTIAAMIHSQRSASAALVSAVTSAPIITHHTIGAISASNTQLVSPGSGYINFAPFEYTISAEAAVSIESSSGSSSMRSATFEASSAIYASLEGGVGQQTQDSVEPISGAAGLVLENRIGTTFAYVPAGDMAATLPSLNYVSAMGSTLQAAATNQNLSFILPTSYMVSVSGQSAPVFANASLGFGNQISYLIGLSFKGGGSSAELDPADLVLKTVQSSISGKQKKYLNVDVGAGDFTIQPLPDLVTGFGDFPYSLGFQRSYQSSGGAFEIEAPAGRASLGGGDTAPAQQWSWEGVDQDDQARLGGGWSHNFQIGASIHSDGLIALGQRDALDASSAVAGVYALVGLLSSPTPADRYASFMVSYWLTNQLNDNVVSIRAPPSVEKFEILPDGTFNPPPQSTSQLIQSGVRVASGYQQPRSTVTYGKFNYSPVSFTYKMKDGSVIGFDSASVELSGTSLSPFGDPIFKANSWAFPNGVAVNFSYSLFQGSGTVYRNYYYLSGVKNNLGRSLSILSAPTTDIVNIAPSGQPADNLTLFDYGRIITSVTDENGRAASFSLSNCPSIYPDPGSGLPTWTAKLACNTFSATGPDGTTSTYSYVAAADSPDPIVIDRPSYRMRRWYTQLSSTTPYQVIAYDSAYRVQTVTDILGHATGYYASDLFPLELWKRTDVVDPLGNVSTSWFDEWGDQLQSVDPLGRVSTAMYDGVHRKVLEADPLLGCTATTYDVRSNVLSASRYPAPTSASPATGCSVVGQTVALNASPGTPIVTSATYGEGPTVYPCSNGVTCNKPVSQTDPRGGVTNYTYNTTTGQVTQVLKPADASGNRPESDYNYTGYAGIGSVGGTVSLLNSKTDWISKSPSKSVVTSYAYNTANKLTLSTATVDSGTGGLALRSCFKFDAVGNLISTSDPRATTCP